MRLKVLKWAVGTSIIGAGYGLHHQINRGIEKPELNPNRYIDAQIWLAQTEEGKVIHPVKAIGIMYKNQNASVGHIALQPSDGYGPRVSYWPSRSPHKKEPVPGRHHPTIEVDIRSEDGRHPDRVIRLYSLDLDKFKEAVHQVNNRTDYWMIKGTKSTNDLEMHNCSSFALEVLYFIGLGRLNPDVSKLRGSKMPIHPNSIERCLLKAKASELKMHPETAEFDKPDSTTRPSM